MAEPLDSLRNYAPGIEAELRAFMARTPDLFTVELSQQIEETLEHLSEFVLRPAKRIRGSLAALAYDTATGNDGSKQALQLGAVLELLQAYLLIVDDVMDKSELRRGKATLHRLFGPMTEEVGGEHAANMLAVNVGLLSQHLANTLLLQIAVPAERHVEASRLLHTNISMTAFGQIEDMFQTVGRHVEDADVIRKYTLKSSYYSFVNPLQLGFALAGKSDPTLLAACEAFGVPAGIAFQLHDDHLGIFGDTATGKSNLDDLREGKFTLMVAHALAQADEKQNKQLRSLLGNTEATEADLQAFRDILLATGADEYCKQQALVYADHARRQLSDGAIGSPAMTDTLNGLLEYIVTRNK